MLAKNLPPVASALWKIPFRLWLDAIAAWKGLLLVGDGGYFMRPSAKAHVHFFKWIFLHQKQSVFPVKQRGRSTQGWRICMAATSVWQHFVKGKKRFSRNC